MMNATTSPQTTRKPRRDLRIRALLLLLACVLGLGTLIQWQPESQTYTEQPQPSKPEQHAYQPFDKKQSRSASSSLDKEETVYRAPGPLLDPATDPQGHAQQARQQEMTARFNQAVVMLHAKRFDEAIVALNRALVLNPNQPETFVNLGYALLGKEDYAAAYDAFEQAIDLRPGQANAYYGAAIAQEGLGNLEGALGGMRSFLHLTDNGQGQIHVARARSAIWEWESKLGRGPWGPTKGIPPGFTEEELKRNEQGVGIKMPAWDTLDEDGNTKYEIKYQDKFELFDK